MKDLDMAIDLAQMQNALAKEGFLGFTGAYYGKPYVPKGDNMSTVSWTWLFDDYLKRRKKYPSNVWKPISEILFDTTRPEVSISPDNIWSPSIKDLFSYALEFIYDWKNHAIIDEKRLEMIFDKKPGFSFQTSKGSSAKKLQYMELINVPNHGTVVAQTNNSAAAWLLYDVLLRIPAEPDLKEPQRTFSIKLVGEDPSIYTQHLINNCFGNIHE
ncbi:MAG: hypothetical protein FWE50_04585 [Alphaproteobacteria bacterium]|nr:hypothetical protein [Alphaproteobacteria bacterium]